MITTKQQYLINELLNTVSKFNNEFASDKVKNNMKKITSYHDRTIYKRGNKFCTRFRTLEGKQEYVSGDTLDQLKRLLDKLEKNKASKKLMLADSSIKTFEIWWNEYLELYKVGQIRPSTFKSYTSVYKIHLHKLSELYLSEITVFVINDILKSIDGSRQKQQVYDILKACLQKAVDLELIKKNPCALLPRPKHSKERINAMSHQEQKDFISAMQNDKCSDYYLFLLLTGCRRGEALAVTRADVDFEKMTIKINKTLSGGKIGTTKTVTSIRNIPIFKQLYNEVLFKYKNLAPEQRLFELSEKQIEKHFYNICKKANVENISLHSFRHTFASRCFEIGIPALQIKEWLGHKDVTTTQQIYIHLMQTTQQKYLNIANNYDFIATQSATQIA